MKMRRRSIGYSAAIDLKQQVTNLSSSNKLIESKDETVLVLIKN